jgi:hypothetical protein
MDRSEYMRPDARIAKESRLRAHTLAVRRNKDVLGHIFLFLSEEPPNASAAQEAFEELSQRDQIELWSCSPRDGGIWETWERDSLKYGRLDATNSYAVWQRRPVSEEA